jgi:hypothetical protein
MVRRLAWLALPLALAACRPAPSAAGLGPRYRLSGFTVVDPAARTESVRDLWVVDGALATRAPAGSQGWPALDGRGRWLLPGLRDLSVASWGNDSAKDFRELSQPMGADALLKAQLYAGVTRVTVTRGAHGKAHSRFGDGLRRIAAFGIPAARGGVASPFITGPGGGGFFALTVSGAAQLAALLDAELAEAPDYLWLDGRRGPGLPPALLAEAAARAHRAGRKALVVVGDAREGRVALAAGADALAGGPFGPGAEALFRALAAQGRPWVSSPVGLDLAEAERPDGFQQDPLARALVAPLVLRSFLDLGAYSPLVAKARAQCVALGPAYRRELALAARLGAPLLAVSEAGWNSCSFQGEGLQRCALWMGRSGVPAWAGLAALTTVPATFLGERCGFADGDPADLLALVADPVADLANTERLSGVCVGGSWPERDGLKPDLWRRHY